MFKMLLSLTTLLLNSQVCNKNEKGYIKQKRNIIHTYQMFSITISEGSNSTVSRSADWPLCPTRERRGRYIAL